ncbi:MAG TPA: hypothetical protein VF635_04490 [Propionibacteriaceae bacterium]|jgi:hypothetical protein
MSDSTSSDAATDHPATEDGAATTPAKGAPPPGMSSDLNDQVAQQAESGISSVDAGDHAGTSAPASEGQPPG